jgi:hypothetical protein
VIPKVDCTEHSLLAIEVLSAEVEACNMTLSPHPLGQLIFRDPRDQLRPGSFHHKREEPGNEVDNSLRFSQYETERLQYVDLA